LIALSCAGEGHRTRTVCRNLCVFSSALRLKTRRLTFVRFAVFGCKHPVAWEESRQNPGNSKRVQTFFQKQYFCVTKTGRAFPLFPLRSRKSLSLFPLLLVSSLFTQIVVDFVVKYVYFKFTKCLEEVLDPPQKDDEFCVHCSTCSTRARIFWLELSC
jgi:hypothetical protein